MGLSVGTYKPWHLPITLFSSISSSFLMKFMQNSCFFSCFMSSLSLPIFTCTSNQKGLQMLHSCRVVAKENLRELYLCSSLGEESGPQGTEQLLETVARRLVSMCGSDQEEGIILCVIPEATGLLQFKAILSSVQPSIKGMSFSCCVLSPSPFLLSFSFLPLFIFSFLFSSFPLPFFLFPLPYQLMASDFFLCPAYLLSFQIPDGIHCCFTTYLHSHSSTLALFIKILLRNKVGSRGQSYILEINLKFFFLLLLLPTTVKKLRLHH